MTAALMNKPKTSYELVRLKTAVNLKSVRESGNASLDRYIGLENIEPWTGRLLLSPETNGQANREDSETKSIVNNFEAGDILFGKLRPYLAKAYLAKESGVCTTELLVLKPSDRLDGRFLKNVILTSEFINAVNAETYGVKMPRADWNTISNLLIPLPSLSQQRQIADYLDDETAKLDALIAAKQRLLTLLAEKRRAMITQAVIRGLDADAPMRDSGVSIIGKFPQHWKVTYLRRVLSQVDYGISESVGPEGEFAILRMGDIHDGEISYEKIGFVESVDSELILEPGDLLFNRTNSLDQVGKVGIFRKTQKFPVSFASYLVRMRCGRLVIPEFLNYLLNAPPMLTWARSEALPSIGQANLNPNRYSYLPIPIPPIEEQIEITKHLVLVNTQIDKLLLVTQNAIALLQERRTSLISAAVTGQLHIAA